MRPRGTPENKGMSIDLEEMQELTTEGHAKKMTPESITESKELTKIEPQAKNGPSLVAEEADAATTVQVENVTDSSENHGVAVNAENEPVFPVGRIEELQQRETGAMVEVSSFDHLMSLMEQSRQQSLPVALVGHGLVIPTPEEIEAVLGEKTRDLLHLGDIPTMAEHETAVARGDVSVVASPLGPQANGDYGVVVMIPEQLVSGVLGQAELDGVTPGEWLTPRLAELLEGWFHGA